jgi:hypothetical protein
MMMMMMIHDWNKYERSWLSNSVPFNNDDDNDDNSISIIVLSILVLVLVLVLGFDMKQIVLSISIGNDSVSDLW